MGSDCAKNCTVAAIRNSDSSRIISLAILLMLVPNGPASPARAKNGLLPCWSNRVPEESYRGNDLRFIAGLREFSLQPSAISRQLSVKPGHGRHERLRPSILSNVVILIV